jgi:hypothetical protein
MDATTSPLDAYRPLAPIMDTSTGGLTAWLVLQMNTLGRCDSDFANCTPITSFNIGVNLLVEGLDHYMLQVDNSIRSYEVASNTLSSSLFDIPLTTWITDDIYDGNRLFFSHETSVYAVPVDGSSTASLLSNEANPISSVELSGSHVIITTTSGTSADELRAVPKSGGASNLLVSASGDNHIFVISLGNNLIYYNEQDIVASPSDPYWLVPAEAGIVSPDASFHVTYTNATWSGETMKRNWDLNLGYSRSLLTDKVILVEGYELAGSGGGYAGATVTAFDADSGLAENVLGTLPVTEGVTFMFCTGYTKDALCQTNMVISPLPAPPEQNYQGDIFYIDSTTGGSLMRSTTTPNSHDTQVSYL